MSSAHCFRELEINYSITGLSPAKICVEHFALIHKCYEVICVIW